MIALASNNGIDFTVYGACIIDCIALAVAVVGFKLDKRKRNAKDVAKQK